MGFEIGFQPFFMSYVSSILIHTLVYEFADSRPPVKEKLLAPFGAPDDLPREYRHPRQ